MTTENNPTTIPDEPQSATLQVSSANQHSSLLFLYIPIERLVLLSIAPCGLYYAYWIYKNWWFIKKRDRLKIHPFLRGVFGYFFCHSLFKRIHSDALARSTQEPSFSPRSLATGFIILSVLANILSGAQGSIALVSFVLPSFLFIIPIQNYINSVTRKKTQSQRYYGWSSGHVVCLVLGLSCWALTIWIVLDPKGYTFK